MAATITKTIKSSGGDYTTVTGWEAAAQGNLVTLDEIHQGVIYDVNPTSALTIDGSTTDATRYMELTVDSAYRHAGKWDTAKQNFQVSSTDATIIIADDYTRISWVQLKNTHATNGGSGVRTSNTGCYFEQVICVGTAGSLNHGIELASTATNCVLNNNICHGCHNGIAVSTGTGTVISNCVTVANRGTGVNSSNGAALAVKNHYSGGNTTANYREGGSTNISSWTFTTSMSSNTESTEAGLTNSIAYSTANFTNVTAGSEDLHLVSGSALIDQGTDLSGSFTIDVDGVTRTGTWDIGADEYVAAGGTTYFSTVAGTLTSAGAVLKHSATAKAGTLTTAGALLKQTTRTLVGTLTTAGALSAIRTVLLALTASLSTAGALTKQISTSKTGTLSPAGGLAKQIARTLVGTLTTAGALSAIRTVLLALTASLSTAGALTKQISTSKTGTLSPAGGLAKQIARVLVGALSTAGALSAVNLGVVVTVFNLVYARLRVALRLDRDLAVTQKTDRGGTL